jgi:hypothetical protein
MGHRCFISFKTEDKEYKRIIQEDLKIDMIDDSLDEAINSLLMEIRMLVFQARYRLRFLGNLVLVILLR